MSRPLLRLPPSGRWPPDGHSMFREAPVRGALRTTGSGNSGWHRGRRATGFANRSTGIFWACMPEGEYNLSRVRLPFVSHSASSRYEGWAVMAGFSYGYSWVLGKRWNLEATVGAGWVHAEYKRFNCPACGEYRGADKKNFLAPTRVGVSLIYMLK